MRKTRAKSGSKSGWIDGEFGQLLVDEASSGEIRWDGKAATWTITWTLNPGDDDAPGLGLVQSLMETWCREKFGDEPVVIAFSLGVDQRGGLCRIGRRYKVRR